METFLPFRPQHGENKCVSGIKKYYYYSEISFCRPKNVPLVLVLFDSVQCDRVKSVTIFVSGKLSEIGTGANKVTD